MFLQLWPAGRAVEQGVPDGFDAAPVLGELVLVLLQPQRGGGGDLRGGRRGAFPVEPDHLGAAEQRPGNVRGVGGDGGVHRRLRAGAALQHVPVQVPVRLSVRHHPAHRDNPVVAGRVHHRLRWRRADMVSGRRANADPVLVGEVDRVSPRRRRQPAHAQRHDVAPLLHCVAESLRERAGAQQRDPISHPQRQHLRLRGTPHRPAPRAGGLTGQNPQRAGSMSGVVHEQHPIVWILGPGRVAVALDETPLQMGGQMRRNRGMAGEIAGVDMGDPGPRVRELHLGVRAAQLGEIIIQMPGETIRQRRLAMGCVLPAGLARVVGSQTARRQLVGVGKNVVHQVRLNKQHLGAINTQLRGHLTVRHIPRRRRRLPQLSHIPRRTPAHPKVPTRERRVVQRPDVHRRVNRGQHRRAAQFHQHPSRLRLRHTRHPVFQAPAQRRAPIIPRPYRHRERGPSTGALRPSRLTARRAVNHSQARRPP